MTRTITYRSQAEARREIVIAIWGDVHFSKRPFVLGDLITFDSGRTLPETVVSANVNGRLVTFSFDQYGREGHRRPIVGDWTGA